MNASGSSRTPRLRSPNGSRITLDDIARDSGLSVATVDRVINARPGVHGRTRNRVLEVASRLGYITATVTELPEVSASAPIISLDFVLPDGTNSFILNLAQQIELLGAARPDLRLRLHMIEGFNPAALAAKLAELVGRSHGVGITALDHPVVREAIRSLTGSGIPVLTLASDITQVPRIAYVGIDNRAAGRLAGYLLGRFLPKAPAKIALFAGSLSYRGHEEREMGFRHIVSEAYPDLSVVELREVNDDTGRGYEEAKALLGKYADIAGIYSIGGGTEGIARALEETGRAQDVVFVGHELTEHTRRFLMSGTMDVVIDQNPRVEAREAIDLLTRAARQEVFVRGATVRVHAIFRENLPE
ncbi:LacI family DNA-binding transcriptional regulator [Acidisoma cladoniae]|jgi:LacI family transcriptional regulator|uniref:LacI family DNA-binding transcriptional regulator n=1 Tax=Acidisoma cladoniae TaxID=3040935 RepID=UPI002550D73C|nr:LacI family DNA-binding transcriptional regulator [Acidisoma sp. PAMC 29798]